MFMENLKCCNKGVITAQKYIADELLSKLEAIDPYVILAGGGPRNWFFDIPANDLDFYLHTKGETMSAAAARFNAIGLEMTPMFKDDAECQYNCMKHLHRIYEGEYKGMVFQVMFMTEPTFTSVIPHFGTSVCKAWYKSGKIETTLEFLLSHYTKTIFKKEDYTAKVLHVDKMMKYYPDYKVLDYNKIELELELFCRRQNIYPTDSNAKARLNELMNTGNIKIK